jgi:hypothetical protein
MELFDAPTTTDSCSLRMQSTVPTQALVLMNDEFVEDQAGFLAERAKREAGANAIPQMFRITLGREPAARRLQEALEFVQARAAVSDQATALRDLAHVLLNSSEFLYIE